MRDADVFMSLRFLPGRKQKEVTALLNIYKEVDRKLNEFKRQTGLRCPSGCGECCRTACVASSVLEMQPLAAFLWKKNELDFWLNRIDINDEQAACVFYSPDTLDNSGHCLVYPFRPLLCRLFGFCSRENKTRKNELMLCRKIKDSLGPEFPEAALNLSADGLRAPVSADYVMKAYMISPDLANQCMNINLAFVKAAQIIGYYGELTDCFTPKGGEKKWLTKISRRNRLNKNRRLSLSQPSKTKGRPSLRLNRPARAAAVLNPDDDLPKV